MSVRVCARVCVVIVTKSRHLDLVASECVIHAIQYVYHLHTMPYIIFGNHTVKSSKHIHRKNSLHEMRDAKETQSLTLRSLIPTDNERN